MQLHDILRLEQHGPDTWVGAGPRYPWGGLYGGQIVAQALVAAAASVEGPFTPHSLRAYFIRRGDHDEPVRYEVDRIRNGRTFVTRRVVARQAVGAILNLEASFQAPEPSEDVDHLVLPDDLPRPEDCEITSWSSEFERAFIPAHRLADHDAPAGGRAAAWLRTTRPVGEEGLGDTAAGELDLRNLVQHFAAFAYMSDDLPTDAVIRAHPVGTEPEEVLHQNLFTASLDHAIWFHRPMRADRWHLHDFRCHGFIRSRGLAMGRVFDERGVHVATVAQEVLLRDRRLNPSS